MPYTIHVVNAIRRPNLFSRALILAILFNLFLGTLHMTGMKHHWNFKDHIRLATILVPLYVPAVAYNENRIYKQHKLKLLVLIYMLLSSIMLAIIVYIRIKTYT